ncbi:hypothetical protein E2C01_028278 [Portunus trituberculatus]|uniref:Uncharacterized protein n=1 Tax=Portunus trituberculatus TaxID=210409 RepID=A0A5B7EN73_PORTR|nr:hypothetical protein [Portunus trituberculatus]
MALGRLKKRRYFIQGIVGGACWVTDVEDLQGQHHHLPSCCLLVHREEPGSLVCGSVHLYQIRKIKDMFCA